MNGGWEENRDLHRDLGQMQEEIEQLSATVDDLRAQRDRVEKLHMQSAAPRTGVTWCERCRDLWPCATARALAGPST